MREHSTFFGSRKTEAFRRHAWWLLVFWALSPYSVRSASAAQVCTTNAVGQTVCHDKLSAGAISAIVVTILLVLLLCIGIYYVVRRTRAHRSDTVATGNWMFGHQIPALAYSGRRRRDAEEGDDDSDDEKYLSVEKNQIQGPTWEARYDPSSAPIPGKSTWSSRLRGIKSGGRSGSEFGNFGYGPASAPGYEKSGGISGIRDVPPVKKPRSAGTDSWTVPSPTSQAKRHWGSLIHGSQSKNGSRSAGPGPAYEQRVKAGPGRTRASPGLQIIAEGHGGYYNSHSPVVHPVTPHTPRTPSRLGTAPPVSAGPNGFSSAPTAPRTPRTPGTPLTPRPAPAYSPVAPRGHLGAI